MRKITYIFIGVAFIAIAGYDIYALIKGGTESSISHILIEASYKYPVMTFAFGMLAGHLFWRVRQGKVFNKMDVTKIDEK